jgi:hypothetical protein
MRVHLHHLTDLDLDLDLVNFSQRLLCFSEEAASEAQAHRVGGGLPARGTSLSIEQAHGGHRALSGCSRERVCVCVSVCVLTQTPYTTRKVQSRYQNGVLQFDPSALWVSVTPHTTSLARACISSPIRVTRYTAVQHGPHLRRTPSFGGGTVSCGTWLLSGAALHVSPFCTNLCSSYAVLV